MALNIGCTHACRDVSAVKIIHTKEIEINYKCKTWALKVNRTAAQSIKCCGDLECTQTSWS